MSKRPSPVSQIGLALLLAGWLTACRGATVALPGPATASPPAATTTETVWGKVSTCPCKGDELGRIASSFDDARLGVDFELGPSNPEYRYFSVRFDPRVVPRARVVAIIEANGGNILTGPP